ncbi:MAG: DoxX family protein [Rikenellaceae bacterium]
MDWALLYLRIFTGGLIMLHNIAKMQNYNVVISSYPSALGLSGAGWFTIIAAIELTCAVGLVVGKRVRTAAATLLVCGIATVLLYFSRVSGDTLELSALYASIFILFIITGGGRYTMDEVNK